jgi:hypothetical protein
MGGDSVCFVLRGSNSTLCLGSRSSYTKEMRLFACSWPKPSETEARGFFAQYNRARLARYTDPYAIDNT